MVLKEVIWWQWSWKELRYDLNGCQTDGLERNLPYGHFWPKRKWSWKKLPFTFWNTTPLMVGVQGCNFSGNFTNFQQNGEFCYILNGQWWNFEKVTNFCYNLNWLWQNFRKSLCCVKVQMDHFCGSTSQVSAVWAVLLWIWFMNGPQLWSSFWIFPASPCVL